MAKMTRTFYALGTRIRLTTFDADDPSVLACSEQLVAHYEDLLTVNRPVSEVQAINHAASNHPVTVSAITYELISRAVEVSLAHPGFDVAIGPLVDLWHIGFKDAKVPSTAAIAERRHLIDPRQIILDDDEQSVFLTQAGMSLDLGGIGKGYIADAIEDFWAENNCHQGIIDLGGNLVMVGESPHTDRLWRVGVQDPKAPRNQSLGILTLTRGSIVTSGIYERFLTVDGHVYHHILDPLTGYPVDTSLVSVTVVSDRSIDGEIFSSLGFYYGPDKITSMLIDHPDVGLVFTLKDGTISVTKNLNDRFQLTNPQYRQRGMNDQSQ